MSHLDKKQTRITWLLVFVGLFCISVLLTLWTFRSPLSTSTSAFSTKSILRSCNQGCDLYELDCPSAYQCVDPCTLTPGKACPQLNRGVCRAIGCLKDRSCGCMFKPTSKPTELTPILSPSPTPSYISSNYKYINISLGEPHGLVTSIDFLPDNRFVAGISVQDENVTLKDNPQSSLMIQKDNKFVEKFDIPDGAKILKHVPSVKVSPVDGSIWMLINDLTNKTGLLAQFKNDNWSIFQNPSLRIAKGDLAIDKDGNIWIATSDPANIKVLVFLTKTSTWKQYGSNIFSSSTKQLNTMLSSIDNNIYLGIKRSAISGDIYKYNPTLDRWSLMYLTYLWDPNYNPSIYNVIDLAQNNSTDVWLLSSGDWTFSGLGNYIYRMTSEGKVLEFRIFDYLNSNFMTNYMIGKMAVDIDNMVWMTATDGGMYVITPERRITPFSWAPNLAYLPSEMTASPYDRTVAMGEINIITLIKKK